MKSSSGVESTSVMSCEWVITLEAVSWAQVPVVERSRDDMCGIVVSAQRLGRCYYETMKSSSGVESTSVMSCEWVITLEAVSWAQVPVVERSRDDMCGIVVSAQRLGRCYYETMKSSSGVESTSVMSCEWVITIKAVSWAQVPVVERSRDDMCGIVVSA